MDTLTNGLSQGDLTLLRVLRYGAMTDILTLVGGGGGGGTVTSATLPRSTAEVKPPPSASATAVSQSKCSHRKENSDPATKQYVARKHGRFMRCEICLKRWKWNPASEMWEDADPPPKLSSAKQVPSLSASSGSVPPSEATSQLIPRPSVRARAAEMFGRPTVDPGHPQFGPAVPTYPMDMDAESDVTGVEEKGWDLRDLDFETA